MKRGIFIFFTTTKGSTRARRRDSKKKSLQGFVLPFFFPY